jgi:hypothetical protein
LVFVVGALCAVLTAVDAAQACHRRGGCGCAPGGWQPCDVVYYPCVCQPCEVVNPPSNPPNDGPVVFAGKWTGQWSNSLGETGKDSLVLTEDKDGNVSGTWTEMVELKGKRVNPTTVELNGKTDKRSYQLTATVQDGVMHVKYVVTRLNMQGSYDGQATLKKQD